MRNIQKDKETFLKRHRNISIMSFMRCSLPRFLRYRYKKLLRLSASPHSIALGVALGGFFAFTPFVGLQFVFAIIVAWFLRANIAAALLGTFFANPITLPFIFSADFYIGSFLLSLLGQNEIKDITDLRDFFTKFNISSHLEPVLKPLFLGSIALGFGVFILFYLITFWAVTGFKHKRKMKLLTKKYQD